MLLIARLVRLIVGIIVLLIVAAIVLRVLDANASNTIVRDVHDVARALVGPFDNLFTISKPKLAMAVNWGIAALVYLFVGGLIARLFARAAPTRRRPGRAGRLKLLWESSAPRGADDIPVPRPRPAVLVLT